MASLLASGALDSQISNLSMPTNARASWRLLQRCSLESSQVQMLGGSLDAEHWHTIEQQVADLVTQPGVQAWWKLRRHWRSACFRDWIDALPQRTPATIYEEPPNRT